MNRDYYHPIQKEPPIAHALDKWNPETRMLTYEYNGRNIITVFIPGNEEPDYRKSSDIAAQSFPMYQQAYIMLRKPVVAKVVISMSPDAVNIRPERAGHEQAILGQVGRPLMFGANGMYDINQDLLVDWHGMDWKWTRSHLEYDDNGELFAELEVKLGPKPWFVNIRPQYYRTHLGYRNHMPWKRKPNTKSVAGWCSWEAYSRNVAQEDIENASDFLCKTLKDYGLEYVQLDDGYERMPCPYYQNSPLPKSWLDIDEKFPDGHKGIVGAVKKHGLKAGIWTGVLISREYAEKHSDCLLKDVNGDLLDVDWMRFVLDCRPDTLREQILPVYKAFREYGYEYVKTDSLRHLIYDGLHESVRQGLMTNDEAYAKFRAFVECIRDGLGNDIFHLACWGVMTDVAGISDACRIAQDANPSWTAIRMQMVETARWFHTQRILFVNDPDHICARTHVEWAKSLISLVSLTGSLFMLSDPIEYYKGERLEIIRKNLPPLPTVTGETGALDYGYAEATWTKLHGMAFNEHDASGNVELVSREEAFNMAGASPTMNDNHPISTLWAIHIDNAAGRWCVAGRYATVPLKASEVEIESLGLDPELDYLAFDFWEQEYLGIVSGKFSCRELDIGHCQIIALRTLKQNPQFLASTRHVSMDAVSVKLQVWQDKELTLEISAVEGTTEDYWFHIPGKYNVMNVCIKGAEYTLSQDGELLRVNLHFMQSSCALKLEFGD